mgnify:CR=1 FL=1
MAYSKEVIDRFEGVLNNPAEYSVGRFNPKDPIKLHCSVLAEGSIKSAIEDWESKTK